jgi:hypothetical protein
MTIVETGTFPSELTFRQRWSHYLAFIFAAIGFVVGLNLRDSTLGASTIYSNPQAGVVAAYPRSWLLDESSDDYIFEVRDITIGGFETTIRVAAQPISAQTSARNIFDALTLSRAQVLAAYSVISEQQYTLPDGSETSAMTYTFVSAQVNPFLQNIPVVVEGIDILITTRGQAIIISFLAEASRFEDNLPVLEQFLRRLEF